MILDPNKQVTLTHGLLHENVDYSPYEGIQVTGWPVSTMVRGNLVVHREKLVGTAGSGKFIKRNIFKL